VKHKCEKGLNEGTKKGQWQFYLESTSQGTAALANFETHSQNWLAPFWQL
jgi:hypothetical protein